MLERLGTNNCPEIGRLTDRSGRFGLAQASLGFLCDSPQPATLHEDRYIAVLDGELYDVQSADLVHASNGRQRKPDHARILATCYTERGLQAITSLDGSFAAAIVDAVDQKVILISDRFGTRPLYYSHRSHGFSFASRISAVLADRAVARRLDLSGISQFLTFGHYLGESTSLAEVKLLPAAAVLVFDARQDRFSIRKYWAGRERIGERPQCRQASQEAVDDAFVKSVRRCQQTSGVDVGLSLSGGLDARTILGTLDHRQNKVTTVCLGMHGSRDHKASAALARIVGCKHHNHVLDTRFLSEFSSHLDNMVLLTDGQYLSQCIVMPTLPLYRQLGIGVLLRGHGGELMHMSKAYNYSLEPSALGLRSDVDLEEWLWSRLTAYIHDGVDGPLLATRDVDMVDTARASLRQVLTETPLDEPPAKRIVHLFLDQRVRRETMLSLMKFRSVTEPRLPYLDRVLVERLLAIPVEWQWGDELQSHILQRHQPKFCTVENTNTGASLGAGVLWKTYAQLRMRILSKLGVPGYQPYERLGLWLQRELAEVVKSTLLSDQCLSRGVFRPDTLRRVVERHLSGQRNHTYLILAAMIFERGHRWLLDEVDDCEPATTSANVQSSPIEARL
jgi:asparagine synthase (glutamine-hydrolysing)